MKIVKDDSTALSIDDIEKLFPYARLEIERELEMYGFITVDNMIYILSIFLPEGIRIADPCPELSHRIGWNKEDRKYTIL